MPGAWMQVRRTRPLQEFLKATSAAIGRRAPPDGPGRDLAERIFGALEQAAPRPVAATGFRLPACIQLPAALARARDADRTVAGVADAFAGIEPELTWARRAGAEQQGPGFAENHANTIIVGPGGIEPRDDVLVG